jgi:hypothetical protein
MTSLNSEKWPERWNDIYDSVMDDFEANGLKLINPDYYDEIAEKYGVLEEMLDTYKRIAKEISEDEPLARLLALIAASMRDRENIRADIKALGLPKSADGAHVDKYTMLPALAMCETLDYTYSLIKDRNFPEERVRYLMHYCDGTNMVKGYQRRNGGKLGTIHWGWFQLAVEAKLHYTSLLTLELDREFTPRATVFQNAEGEIVTAAHSEIFHRDGYILGTPGFEDEEGSFEPTLTETDDAYIVYLYDARGFAKNETTVLKKSEWKIVLKPGDPVIDLHIPAGKPLKEELVDASFEEIREFLATYYPEKEFKGFIITSWLLSPLVCDLLEGKGNISKFGNRFIKITKKDKGTSVMSFVFLQKDVNNVDYAALPENTSLERALKKHYLEGKKIYDTFGYILD